MDFRTPRLDLRVPDAEADLYLVGLGIGGYGRRTMDSHGILSGVSLIMHLTAFDEELRRDYPQATIVNLKHLYESDDVASDVYEEMTRAIEEKARDFSFLGPSAFLTYGHPLYLVDTAWALLERSDLRVTVSPAASFFDQLLFDTNLRLDRTVQMYEANRLQQLRPTLDKRTPLVVPQVGDLGATLRPGARPASHYLQFFSHILKFYPPDREFRLVLSGWRSDMAPQVTVSPLERWREVIERVHVGTTLIVLGEETACT